MRFLSLPLNKLLKDMKTDSFDTLLKASSLSVNNTLANKEAQQALAKYGFTPQHAKAGKGLLTNCTKQDRAQKQYYETQWALNHRVKKELKTTRAQFVEHVNVARFVFRKDAVMLHQLGVQRLERTEAGWLKQANAFYERITPHAAQLAPQGVTPEELAQAQASLQAIVELREELARTKGDAEDATQRKLQAQRELKEWLSEFRKVARLAFKKSPQKLEAFGIRVR